MITLTDEEARVAGSLAEKALTTPQYYPLTMNALVAACNQSNNRDPVVQYDDGTVEGAMASLREKGMARLVHPGGGSRVVKYRHAIDEALGLDRRELALVCVLLLRGPQTLNELRTRTERMADFDSVDEVERDLDRLATQREEPLIVRLERRPGQKEPRYACTLVPVSEGSVTTTMATTAVARAVAAVREPRLGPLSMEELTDEQRELVESTGNADYNLFRTLVRHPGLFRRWAPFGGKLLLRGSLPPRWRELAILRTAHLTGAAYEWRHHVAIAKREGLTDDEIGRIADGTGWSGIDGAVIGACDDLHAHGAILDPTWRVLRAHLDDAQLVELPMLVGHYRMLAGVMASLGIEPEPEFGAELA